MTSTAGLMPRLMLIATATVTLTACDGDDRGQHGERTVHSETRPVDAFDSIEMEGTAKLEIRVGSAPSLVIEGAENVLSQVRTDVHGHTLHIDAKPRRWQIVDGLPRLKVTITVPQLESLSLEGGNKVRVTGFDGGESTIKIAGTAHIEAGGRLDQLTVDMAGAGHADLSKLFANDVKVTVDGVGSVVVSPKDTLKATMNGVGAILYTGSPRKVSTRMNGLGTIGQAEEEDDMEKHSPHEDEPPLEIDPDKLQPEREERVKDQTEVI